MKTGWPPGLLQDDDRKLSRWFAGKPDARYQLRKSMKEDIIKMAREAGIKDAFLAKPHPGVMTQLERLVAIVEDAQAKRMHAEGMVTVGYMRQQIAAERNKVASWMMAQGYATGHGDTVEDLLRELEWQIAENWTRGMVNGVQAEREACAAVARQWDADHPASNYGGCIANLIKARGQA
jgi:hypothetical protein